jgi:hypothetical protein
LNPNPTERNRDRVVNCAIKPTKRTGKPDGPTRARVPERFRRLKWNELVCQGDFVADERLGLEPWEGPGGFRADAFVKPIYRRKETGRLRPAATGKSKRNPRNERRATLLT